MEWVGPIFCFRGALAVKPDEAFNPVGIRLLGADAVVLQTDLVPQAIEQPRGNGGPHVRECAANVRPY